MTARMWIIGNTGGRTSLPYAFTEQVKNNIEKFPDDFMFQVTYEELSIASRSQIVTMNKSGNLRGFNVKYLPKAFTELGIYMLMTVLKGDLAI